MYCPKCGTEYRDGFTECADCNVPLVSELPIEEPPSFVDFEEVLITKDCAEVAFVKSLLNSENIPFVVQGDHFSNLYGYIVPVRFMVAKDKILVARELLGDLL